MRFEVYARTRDDALDKLKNEIEKKDVVEVKRNERRNEFGLFRFEIRKLI